MMVKTLKSNHLSRPFTFTDHHTGQARPSGPGVPNQEFGTDASASGRSPLGVEGLHTIGRE